KRAAPTPMRAMPKARTRCSVVVVMGMIVRVALTGPVVTLSTAWLPEVAATVLPGAELLHVVGERHSHLGGERRVVLPEVLERHTNAGLVGHRRHANPA